ncbi:UDP-galactopyranose mutase [Marinitoga sp. 1135]|uniref:UDP-galactopyranose mutase n=1 Tax=unclassified Marinitoga TaxID=2640159 RepID=UPI001585F08C|nr:MULTISPECIES: UDP-galactopyranose mutase [unclassified Marinitoga]NUU95863.1 UDP-galactopyranose mutase [Marinitoga sp. 1135]NUU97773.1 UDP-galactopyranose mutase [Marinitoga sp. 1138]
MKYEIVIVGAGLAGATAARLLAEKGKKVLVIEQHKHIAGHCHDYKNEHGITVHTYGPHIFHTKNKKVWDFVNRFTEFHYYQHKVLSYAEGKLIPFPINRDTLKEVFGIEIGTHEVKEFLEKEVKKSKFNNPPKNFRDAVVSQVGERLYEMFFKNYTIKQWERDPEELSAEIAKRIPVRENRDDRYFSDQYQGIPKHGYTKMVENMLDHENISLLLGADYFEVNDLFESELTIYTGELDRFFDYKYGKLEYRSLELKFKTFDKEYYQPVATVNYPNDYDWTRITEFKHFLDEKSNKTTVCFEYPKAEGEPYYVVMTEDNMEKRKKYMEEVEKLEKTGKYIFVGRLAEYKYYNMDQVIEKSIERVEEYLK